MSVINCIFLKEHHKLSKHFSLWVKMTFESSGPSQANPSHSIQIKGKASLPKKLQRLVGTNTL